MRWGDETLVSRTAIRKLFKEGVAFHGQHLVLILRREASGPRKVLFVASRRVGKAVVRNRVRRLLREILRASSLEPGWDIVFIARLAAATADYAALKASVIGLLLRARMLAKENEKYSLSVN